MHLDNGLLQNVKKNISIYVQTSAQAVGLQLCSTFTARKIKFHVFIDQDTFSENLLIKFPSYLFADLTLCGLIITKRDQLRMGWGNKSFLQSHTENAIRDFCRYNDQAPHFMTTLLQWSTSISTKRIQLGKKKRKNTLWWHLAHGFAWKVKAKSSAKILNNTYYVRMRKQEHTCIKGLASLQSSSQLEIRLFLGIQPGTQCKMTPTAWSQSLEVSQRKNILYFILKTYCAKKSCTSAVHSTEIWSPIGTVTWFQENGGWIEEGFTELHVCLSDAIRIAFLCYLLCY